MNPFDLYRTCEHCNRLEVLCNVMPCFDVVQAHRKPEEMPKFCPRCGGNDLTTAGEGWGAYSAGDEGNRCILEEFLCIDCGGASFWL